MNKQSYLDAQQLKSVCEHYLALYKKDNDDREGIYQNILTALDSLNSACEGEAIIAFTEFIETSLQPICLAAQAADDYDINDIKTLKHKLNKTYDGNLICTSYEKANRNRDKYIEKAKQERSRAASFNTTVTTILPNGKIITEHISNPHEALASAYQKTADGYQEEMNMWQREMDEFDAIEAETAGLFTEGLAIRKSQLGVDVHEQFMKQLNINLKMLGLSGTIAANIWDAIASLFKFTLFKGKDPDGVEIGDEKTDTGWLVENAGKYGLTEKEARYIEEYHPTLANSLYGLSQTDHQGYIDLTVKDIKTKLRDEYFYMMEGYDYSYEAICYLHENNPSLMAALDSHYGPASIPDARMNIYTYLHEHDICVYDPVYNFDAYNIDPNALIYENEVQIHTNCYAYAFGLTRDPRTGELFPIDNNGLQPGYLSGRTTNKDVIYATKDKGQTLVNVIKADAEELDLNFEKYEEGMTGGVRVALVINPIDGPDDDPDDPDKQEYDYHWYFYDEATGNWYNKPGPMAASDRQYKIDYDENGEKFIVIDGYFDGSITNDQELYYAGGKTYLEYPLGDTIGTTWEDDAERNGYSIPVGEFYITRQDGGEFK